MFDTLQFVVVVTDIQLNRSFSTTATTVKCIEHEPCFVGVEQIHSFALVINI